MKKLKLSLLGLGVLLTIGALSQVNFQEALANGGGTGEGGGSQENASTMWREINGKSGTPQAWNQFMSQRGIWQGNDAKIEQLVNEAGGTAGSGGNLVNMCKQSEYIWYYSYPNKADWSPYGDGTNKVPWQSNLVNNKQRWERYMYGDRTSNRWPAGRVVIICSGAYEMNYSGDDTTKTIMPYKEFKIGGADATTELSTQIDSEVPEGVADEAAWRTTHHAQSPTKPLITPIGEYVSTAKIPSKGNAKEWITYMNNLEKVIKSQNGNFKAPENKFDEANQKGLQEGGVWTITESRRWVEAALNVDIEKEMKVSWDARGCSPTSNYGEYYKNKAIVESNGSSFKQKQEAYAKIKKILNDSCSSGREDKVQFDNDYYSTGKVNEDKIFIREGSTPKVMVSALTPYQRYQILSVRCNKTEFNNVVNATPGGKVLSEKDQVLGVIKSPTYSVNNLKGKWFGKGVSGANALKRTGKYDFYTRTEGCDGFVKCTPTPNEKFPNSLDNKLGDNSFYNPIIDKGGKEIIDTAWNNADGITFFRDGEVHKVHTNLWYPVLTNAGDNAGVTILPGDKTFVAINDEYTKGNDLFKIFNTTADKNGIIKADTENANIIPIQGLWATDSDNDIQLNVAWQYPIKTTVKIPGSVTGNDVGLIEVDMKFNTACDMKANNVSENDPWFDVTGTQGFGDKIKFSNDRESIITRFVRSINTGQ